MLPLLLLKTAQKHPVVRLLFPSRHRWFLRRLHIRYVCLRQLVELKNGETYNGHMVQCDSWMNVHLREVICTSKARLAPKLLWLLTLCCVPCSTQCLPAGRRPLLAHT